MKRFVFLLTLVLLLSNNMFAETFEILSFTPPSGWTRQVMNDAVVYRRSNGVGAITLYNGYPTDGTAAAEFAKIWSVRVGGVVRGPAPTPKIERDGDYAIAIGGQQVNVKDGSVSISLVAIVGRGRAVGVSTLTSGDDALREALAFLDSIKINPAAAPASTTATATGEIDVDFDVPAGYTSQRNGRAIVLKPANLNRDTPCTYGFSPSRPSSGNLERDAATALLEPLPGWQVKSEHYNAMRGVAGGGWKYYWLRTTVQQMAGGSMQYYTAMTMAFENGPGKVGVFWGLGETGPCSVDDITFLKLFYSIRPRGVTPDGGKALAAQLNGLWRDNTNAGMAQYLFLPDGRYEYGLGTSTTFGNLETRTGKVTDGRWALRGSDLVLTGGSKGGKKYRVRVYDEFLAGVWRRAASVLDESLPTPLDIQYMWIER
jgi:hypothetical protein